MLSKSVEIYGEEFQSEKSKPFNAPRDAWSRIASKCENYFSMTIEKHIIKPRIRRIQVGINCKSVPQKRDWKHTRFRKLEELHYLETIVCMVQQKVHHKKVMDMRLH